MYRADITCSWAQYDDAEKNRTSPSDKLPKFFNTVKSFTVCMVQ